MDGETDGVSGDSDSGVSGADDNDSDVSSAGESMDAAMGSDDDGADEAAAEAAAAEAADAYADAVEQDQAAMDATRDGMRGETSDTDTETETPDDVSPDEAGDDGDGTDEDADDDDDEADDLETELSEEELAEEEAEAEAALDAEQELVEAIEAEIEAELEASVPSPEALADAAAIMAEHTHQTPADPYGIGSLDHLDPVGMAQDVFDISRTDPDHAASVAEVIGQELADMPYEAETFRAEVMDRVATSLIAAGVLDYRTHDAPRATADPDAVRAAADDILAENFSVSTIGSLFGAEPQLDIAGIADDLVELRDVDQDLAVAAYE
ncbi:MAG: hypothetical protein AAGL98_08070, partial [Planctomycetota bacterium]